MVELAASKSNMSDYLPTEYAVNQCRRCKLQFHEAHQDEVDRCISCKNLNLIGLIQLQSRNIFMFGLLFLVAIFVLPFVNEGFSVLRSLTFPVLGIMLIPVLALNSLFEWLHLRDTEKKYRILPLLMWSGPASQPEYYNKAIKIFSSNFTDYPQTYKDRVLEILVKGIILSDDENKLNWLQDWSKSMQLESTEFMKLVFSEYRELFLEEIKPTLNFGLISDLWDNLEDDEDRLAIIQQLIVVTEDLEGVDPLKLEIFNDELYLFKEEIEPYLEDYSSDLGDTEAFKIYLDTIVPPDIPSNQMGAFTALAAEAQKIRQARMDEKQAKRSAVQMNESENLA